MIPRVWSSPGALVLYLVAGVHGGLCSVLAAQGHTPSFPGLLPGERPYLAQAWACLPVYVFAWLLATRTGAVLQRRPWRTLASSVGLAIALPTLCCTLLPDIVGLATYGFPSLRLVVRVAAPMTAGGILWGLFLVFRSGPRPKTAMFCAALAYLGCVAPFLR